MADNEKVPTLDDTVRMHQTATQELEALREKSVRWQETLKWMVEALNARGDFIDFSPLKGALLKDHGLPPSLEPWPTFDEIAEHLAQIKTLSETVSTLETAMKKVGVKPIPKEG